MGKSSINGQFSMAMLNNQMVQLVNSSLTGGHLHTGAQEKAHEEWQTVLIHRIDIRLTVGAAGTPLHKVRLGDSAKNRVLWPINTMNSQGT